MRGFLSQGGALSWLVVVCLATGTSSAHAQSLPAPWIGADVGSPVLSGSATAASDTFTVSGSGSDIGGSSDQFYFVYRPMQGDFEIVARVASLKASEALAKAGVMVRGSLAANAQHAFVGATNRKGWVFVRRMTEGASTDSDGPSQNNGVPGWVRLVREGDLLSAYLSRDGSAWTLLGSETIAMGSTMYVGLAVTSRSVSKTARATFSNVAVSPLSGDNQPPTVSISSPASGTSFTDPSSITITAAASDSDGTVSRVAFYSGSTLIGTDDTSPFSAVWSSPPAGDHILTAVATDNGGATGTSAPVAISVSGSTNGLPSVAITSPASGATFTAPATISVAASASDADGTVRRVDFYQGTTLIGSDRTAPYTASWSNVAAGSYTLTAVARDNAGETRRSAAVSVTVTSGNQAPSVAVTSPASGAKFTAPATITVAASASDADGTVSRVDFYQGTTLIGSDTTAPYGVTWSSVPAGTYTLTARARDDDGATRASAGVSITVSATSNQLPSVSLTSPANGATFTAPASITLAASASDPDGTVAGVDFYTGTQLIGSDTTAPYTGSWSNVAAGTYSLTAIARDDRGASRTSASVTITVGGVVRGTTLAFTPSADHATSVTSYSVALRRSTDAVTATPVASRDLGKPAVVNSEIAVDISALVDPLPSGSYYAVVTAIGSGGAAASAPSPSFTK
ncbi:MAG TPA: Ig-like domain-containing protein [Vicinamibacterales bacterium]|nr:Ig-like domain-containing protein [Vicinamibacterales bacterium]